MIVHMFDRKYRVSEEEIEFFFDKFSEPVRERNRVVLSGLKELIAASMMIPQEVPHMREDPAAVQNLIAGMAMKLALIQHGAFYDA